MLVHKWPICVLLRFGIEPIAAFEIGDGNQTVAVVVSNSLVAGHYWHGNGYRGRFPVSVRLDEV